MGMAEEARKAVSDTITDEEAGIVSLVRLNRAVPKDEWRRRFCIGRLSATIEWRSKDNLWGRFGGGWNWCLGFEAGGRTVIIHLLVLSVIVNLAPTEGSDR